MRQSPGVFNTDQVNRDRMLCPASELMKAELHHQRACQSRGWKPGMPVHKQHDMHRLIGWTKPLGLYADSLMVRVLGLIEEPETEQEKAELQARAEQYWEHHHRDGTELFKNELVERVAPVDVANSRFLVMEAAVLERVGIAEELYPDLFIAGTGAVDKDGLMDYRQLLSRMKQVQPGVFHDTGRDLLLFAHRFFRRSLSHRNKFNAYFLQSFGATAEENGDLRVRLKLDPDIVGHPSSARNLIELEYWRGPLYSDDIAAIPDGVAEHKADDRTREFEGVDRTQVWWKAPESRRVDSGGHADYRTFEIEELIEDPSGGLGDDYFGCRYAHAEFSADESAITHFDGAIRAYSADSYLTRVDKSINRAGKQAAYTKIFRFDGALPILHWKRLLSDFFRGNKLIPEYLGAPEEVDDDPAAEHQTDVANVLPNKTGCIALAALISLESGSIDDPFQVCSEYYQEIAGQLIPYVEIGVGETANHIRKHVEPGNIPMVGFKDGILNLARLRFGKSDRMKASFDTEVGALATALLRDVGAGITRRAAIPLTWENEGLLVTLTIAGDADKVVTVLEQLQNVVDPVNPPSDWIEPLSDLIKATAPRQRAEVNWSGVSHGILSIKRSGIVEQQMFVSEEMRQFLLSNGSDN